MKEGLGENSYASNSLLAISMSKPMIEEAITELYKNMVPKTLCIADLGCSAGPNTLFAASEVVRTVSKLCQKLEHQATLDSRYTRTICLETISTRFSGFSCPGFSRN
ncbi:UNVERIFIED_CONTAM: Salicylate carboxymethyltransferase [Sesamum angustifolium]|uniref:Salicylate carboxymethyltransferase n=1 Tax=Sesamum angustifolium TaxID=2727405 RepID=A0AAW2KMZ4_9LAMI